MSVFDTYFESKESPVISDEQYMSLALDSAKRALAKGDLPIGAALVWSKNHLVEHDTVVTEMNPLNTASVNVLRKGFEMMPHRVANCVLYSTVELDAMSVMTAIHSGINEVVFGAYDLKDGFVSSRRRPFNVEDYKLVYKGGVLAEDCHDLLPDEMKEHCNANGR